MCPLRQRSTNTTTVICHGVRGVRPASVEAESHILITQRLMILKALEETDQNQQLAAHRLGISARTIRNKLKKYREEGTLPDDQ